ncbi:MAG: hypothetical protein ACPGU7_08800 [Gammaproteobacteria bacterium]
MNDPRDDDTPGHRATPGKPNTGGHADDRPPLYNTLYVIVVILCICGLTWLARSGYLQMWDWHPRPGENYKYGWFLALPFGIIGGFMAGSLIMASYLQWHWDRRKGHGKDDTR